MGLIFIRTIIVFITLLVIMRLMGKRQIGEMQPFELVITLLIAELACIPMSDTSIPLLYGIISILTIYFLHQIVCLLDLGFKSMKAVLSGSPSIVLNKQGIDDTQLKKIISTCPTSSKACAAQAIFLSTPWITRSMKQTAPFPLCPSRITKTCRVPSPSF